LYYIRSQNANLQKGVRSFPIPAKAGSTLSAKSMEKNNEGISLYIVYPQRFGISQVSSQCLAEQ
jgi:hypothetical protein